jgi:hypothetical protein
MKRYKPNDNTYVTEYASLDEFLKDINSLPNNRFMKEIKASQRTYSNDSNWSGTATYERAVELITKGWESQAKKLAKTVRPVSGSPSFVQHSKPAYGVVGSQASVPRYLQGIPTNMISRQTTYSKQKVITITKDVCYSCGVSAEEILEESTKAFQIIQALENGGQRVRLNVMVATFRNDPKRGRLLNICKVCIKQPEERLNISKMAFPISHPSMLRRFFFKWWETDPFIDFHIGDGFGHCINAADCQMAMSDNEYVIPNKIPDIDEVIKNLQTKKS